MNPRRWTAAWPSTKIENKFQRSAHQTPFRTRSSAARPTGPQFGLPPGRPRSPFCPMSIRKRLFIAASPRARRIADSSACAYMSKNREAVPAGSSTHAAARSHAGAQRHHQTRRGRRTRGTWSPARRRNRHGGRSLAPQSDLGGGPAYLSLRLGIALPNEPEKVQSTHQPRAPGMYLCPRPLMTSPSTPWTAVQDSSQSWATAGSVVIGHSVHGGVRLCSANRSSRTALVALVQELLVVFLQDVERDEVRRHRRRKLLNGAAARRGAALQRLQR